MKNSTLVFLLLSILSFSSNAQNKDIYSYSFKKGEVMDVILLTAAPDSEKLFSRYKKTAFPVAFEYGYKPQTGFSVSKLTLGTNLPSSILFGKWTNKEKRKGFLSNITSRVPDFHTQRRALFPSFMLTYYEIGQDLNFSINRTKYNVATSFWDENIKDAKIFFKQWKKKVTQLGGKVILVLKNGTSPTGYFYNPTIFCIVQWEKESDFNAFANENPLSSYESLKNVHQLVIK